MAYCCPKCGSRDIICTEKGYNVAKGLFGIVTLGLVGGLAGLHGSKRLVWRCPCCQGSFSEPAIAADSITELPTESVPPAMPVKQPQPKKTLAHSTCKPPVITSRLVCRCGAYNSIYNKTCFSCGAPFSPPTSSRVPCLPAKSIVCACGIKNSLESKHCIACGAWLDYSKLEQIDGQPSFNQQQCQQCGKQTPCKSRKVKYCAHCGELL